MIVHYVSSTLSTHSSRSLPNSPNPPRRGSSQPAAVPHYTAMLSSSLYQISIPDGLESRTYGSLYRLLSRRKQIPLGN